MSTSYPMRSASYWLIGAGATATVLFPGVALVAVGSLKLAASVIGVLAFIVAASASGNARLFTLWCFALTLPLALSKKFGLILNIGGGETAFRLEISDIFLGMLALWLLRDVWSQRLPGLRVPKVTYLWATLMLFGVATAMITEWQRPAIYETFRMARMALLFIVVVNEVRRPARMFHCAAGLTLGVLANSIIGIIQYVRRANLGLEVLGETSPETIELLAQTSVSGLKVWRVSALLLHPNIFGAFLAALLPLSAALFVVTPKLRWKLFFLVTAVLGTGALIATQSRSGWVSFAAAMVVLIASLLFHRSVQKKSILPIGVASLAVILVLVFFQGEIAKRLFQSKEGATVGREEFKEDARRMIAASPFIGHGLNNYVHALPPFLEYRIKAYDYWLPPVHHIYYLWWAETGIVGLALVLFIWGSLLFTGIRNFRVGDRTLFAINAGAVAGLVAFAVDGFFSFTLRLNSTLKAYWVLGALIMAIHYWRTRSEAPAASERPLSEGAEA